MKGAPFSHGLIAATLASLTFAFDDGVGKLPAMGYDTFNAFAGNYDADLCLAQAKVMQDSGLVAAGYTQFILDDFYAQKERNASGYMVANATKFPQGITNLSKQMNQMGVQLAAYGDRGYATCGGFPGSWGHELQDLETWYSWGMTYLKLDNCCTYVSVDLDRPRLTDLSRFPRRQYHAAEYLWWLSTNEGCNQGICGANERHLRILLV